MRPSVHFLVPLFALFLLTACNPFATPDNDTDTLYVTASRDGAGKTGITGQVLAHDTNLPVTDAYVNVYPDALSNLLGPSQFISSPTDAQGHFFIEAPPGDFYVVARKRVSGDPSGPLSPGDLYSEHKRVKTTVTNGRLSIVDLRVAPMQAPMFFKKAVAEQTTTTGIRGVLVDAIGQPVPGSFAVAYTNDDVKRLPDYASTLSDGQGRFVLYLPKSGTYYLGARVHAWDMPRPGELYGKYGGENPEPVAVTEGTFVENIRIVLTPFSGNYVEGKSRRPY
jgi:hypothetical protein